MDKFTYGIAFNVVLLANATKQDLAFLQLSGKERDAIVHRRHYLKQDRMLKSDSVYSYEPNSAIEEKIYYNPNRSKKSSGAKALEALNLSHNIGLAGHEMIHYLNGMPAAKTKSRITRYTDRLTPIITVGTAALGGLIDFSLKSVGVGAAIGGMTPQVLAAAMRNNVSYNIEQRPNIYQGKVEAITNQPPAAYVKEELEKARAGVWAIGDFKDHYFNGYPGMNKIKTQFYEGQEAFLKGGAKLYPEKRVDDLFDQTNAALKAGKIPLYHIK